jgi:hypothetical protein
MNDDIDPKIKETLDEHCEWIDEVTELAMADKWKAVMKAVNDLRPEQMPGMIYTLILQRGNDAKWIQGLIANWKAAPSN